MYYYIIISDSLTTSLGAVSFVARDTIDLSIVSE